MSTINAQNFGDGTDSVPASAVLEGTSKAWAYYDQAIPSVENDYNVTSVTDRATGRYTVNFTTSFSDSVYCWQNGSQITPAGGSTPVVSGFDLLGSQTSSAFDAATRTGSGVNLDVNSCTGFLGDLA